MQNAAAAEAARTPIVSRASIGGLPVSGVMVQIYHGNAFTQRKNPVLRPLKPVGSAGLSWRLPGIPRFLAATVYRLMRVSLAGKPVHHPKHSWAASLQKM